MTVSEEAMGTMMLKLNMVFFSILYGKNNFTGFQ
jgi:hypothetical protein